jgi:selenide,water dikinase
LNIVGFPDDKLPLSTLADILAGGADRVLKAGAVIAGGHTVRDTEIKYGLSVTGVATPQELLTNGGARPGDALVLSKPLGTGFVTTAFKKNRCPADVLAVAATSMAMLNQGASQSAKSVSVSASTDITGFGLAGHAGEMAQASDVTLTIRTSQLPVLPGAAELAGLGYHTRASQTNRAAVESLMRIESSAEPAGLEMVFDAQTSGGLLMSVDPGRADELVRLCRESGAEATAVVGSVAERADTFLVFTG